MKMTMKLRADAIAAATSVPVSLTCDHWHIMHYRADKYEPHATDYDGPCY